ncbi:hypothetical protein ACFQ5M_00800 [Agrilactobacillus yilanensis]|uniref:Uncharacterized protein n=1 Tax=Agrilactobacillus yilanensis TaxID=2485997 RepID=A0ABW4J597_9LACO|nr:hypothetical protein [Agrilactobacillus yilanensis]
MKTILNPSYLPYEEADIVALFGTDFTKRHFLEALQRYNPALESDYLTGITNEYYGHFDQFNPFENYEATLPLNHAFQVDTEIIIGYEENSFLVGKILRLSPKKIAVHYTPARPVIEAALAKQKHEDYVVTDRLAFTPKKYESAKEYYVRIWEKMAPAISKKMTYEGYSQSLIPGYDFGKIDYLSLWHNDAKYYVFTGMAVTQTPDGPLDNFHFIALQKNHWLSLRSVKTNNVHELIIPIEIPVTDMNHSIVLDNEKHLSKFVLN